MKNLCIIYDQHFLLHEPHFFHAENPSRLKAIMEYLEEHQELRGIEYQRPLKATEDQILAVHSKEHLLHLKRSVENGIGMLDPDTYINQNSLEAALLAAGSVVKAVNLVQQNEFRNVFCAVRPPGHHATAQKAMGFCLFNNIAVGVKYALSEYKKKRVAIIDWDVHHGNGTQDIFYDTDKVLFISLHQNPLYPGTGMENETGTGKGKGFTVNYPLPPGTSGNTYIKLFNESIIPRLNDYNPEMLFISAGFDAHQFDPLAAMNLTTDDFARLSLIVKEFAAIKNIPVISTLEGGYNLNALASSVFEHIKVLNS